MLNRRPLLLLTCLGLLVCAGCSPWVITTELQRPLDGYTVTVGEITDELPADYDPAKKPSEDQIQRFKHLLLAELADAEIFSSVPAGAEGATYEVQGSILDFKKGSGVARALIGFGVGNAKVTVALRLIDVKTKEVLFAGNFKGTVSDWTENGKEVFDKSAKNFAKALKKQVKNFAKQQEKEAEAEPHT